jgi:hypothetical protein
MAGEADRELLRKHVRLALRHVGGAVWRANYLQDFGLAADFEQVYSELLRLQEHVEGGRPRIMRGQRSLLD